MRCASLLGLCIATATQFENVCVPPNYVEKRIDSSEAGVCQFKSLVKHISRIISKDVSGDLYALVNPDICEEDTIRCCASCFNKCNVFSQVERLLNDYSFRHTGKANLNVLVRRGGSETEFLTCRCGRDLFLVVVNQNVVTDVDSQVLLVSLELDGAFPITARGRGAYALRLFDYNGILEDPHGILIRHMSSLDFKLSDSLQNDVNRGASWLTLWNLGMFAITYYTVGTFLVLIYYSLRTKRHN